MSSYIEIDSFYRNKSRYDNPADFEVTSDQVQTWFVHSRTTRSSPLHPNSSPTDFTNDVRLTTLILPYVVDPGTTPPIDLSVIPRVYVDFHSKKYNDIRLINGIGGSVSEARFVCDFERYQLDDSSNRVFIHYKCEMNQVMRFRKGDPVVFKVIDRFGAPIPLDLIDTGAEPDPALQVRATFKITPYVNSSEYDNHFMTPAAAF